MIDNKAVGALLAEEGRGEEMFASSNNMLSYVLAFAAFSVFGAVLFVLWSGLPDILGGMTSTTVNPNIPSFTP